MNNLEIRKTMKVARKQLPQATQESAAQKIFKHFISQNLLENNINIGSYHSVNGEVLTNAFENCIHSLEKKIYLPVLSKTQNGHLNFVLKTPYTKMQFNTYNIPEPIGTEVISATSLDIVLVPLVAFDKNCNRLGLGKGYYDKTFAFKQTTQKPMLIGLAYDMQKVDHFNINIWDIPMDMVITETSIYVRK